MLKIIARWWNESKAKIRLFLIKAGINLRSKYGVLLAPPH
jgi:hypothetical protein